MGRSLDGRPFTRRIVELRRAGKRYADLEQGCNRARSTAWFNNLVTAYSGPWRVGPPSGDTIDHFAALMSTTNEHVRQMIAEEWYGVRVKEYSDRVRSLAPRLDTLTDEDAELVEHLVQRLQSPSDPDSEDAMSDVA